MRNRAREEYFSSSVNPRNLLALIAGLLSVVGGMVFLSQYVAEETLRTIGLGLLLVGVSFAVCAIVAVRIIQPRAAPGTENAAAHNTAAPATTAQSIRSRIDSSEMPWGIFAVAIAVGVSGILAYVLQFSIEKAVSVAGVATLVSAASLAAGGVLGFLFGIPRTEQARLANENNQSNGASPSNNGTGPKKPATTAQDTRHLANTNLEEISDWLTKILVGVGLIQIGNIASEVDALTTYLSPGLGNQADSPIFAFALFLYFVVCGFFIGYLWTRLELVKFMRAADREAFVEQIAEEAAAKATEQTSAEVAEVREFATQLKKQMELDNEAKAMASAILNPNQASLKATPEQLTTILRQVSPEAREAIKYEGSNHLGRYWLNGKRIQDARPLFEALFETSPADDRLEQATLHGYLSSVSRQADPPNLSDAEDHLSKAMEIENEFGGWTVLGRPWVQFNRAAVRIQRDTSFNAKPPTPSSPDVRRRIEDDLREVAKSPEKESLRLEGPRDWETFGKWLAVNSLTWESLTAEPEPAAPG